MAKTKAKRFTIVPNPELIRAWEGYKPVFGNDEDIAIAQRNSQLESELKAVDNTILRGGDKTKLTKKMKDILFRESGLISAIIRRNMDF